MYIRTDYLKRAQCDSVKGFFILLVFVSHFMQYVAQAGGYVLNLYIGQCMVAPFLFYSGYGIMESIKAKGAAYVHSMPRHRILSTLVNFDIAVIVFIVLDLILGRPLSLKQVLLSFVCVDSVGNSAWYIFIILCCYIIAYLSAVCFMRHIWSWTMLACIVFMAALSFVRPFYWYDTLLCFAVGMLYSEKKIQIENVCKRYYWIVLSSCIAIAWLLMACKCPGLRGLLWNVRSISFALAVALVTMGLPIRASALEWCGRHLFPLYIYQRIPMIILFTLDAAGFANWRMPLYLVLSLIVSVIIAALYPKWQIKI